MLNYSIPSLLPKLLVELSAVLGFCGDCCCVIGGRLAVCERRSFEESLDALLGVVGVVGNGDGDPGCLSKSFTCERRHATLAANSEPVIGCTDLSMCGRSPELYTLSGFV